MSEENEEATVSGGVKIDGRRLEQRRRWLALTQEALAVEVGVSTRTISRAEKGETISLDVIRRIAAGLSSPPEAFYAEEVIVHGDTKSPKYVQITITINANQASSVSNPHWDVFLRTLTALAGTGGNGGISINKTIGSVILYALMEQRSAEDLVASRFWETPTRLDAYRKINEVEQALLTLSRHAGLVSVITRSEGLLSSLRNYDSREAFFGHNFGEYCASISNIEIVREVDVTE